MIIEMVIWAKSHINIVSEAVKEKHSLKAVAFATVFLFNQRFTDGLTDVKLYVNIYNNLCSL